MAKPVTITHPDAGETQVQPVAVSAFLKRGWVVKEEPKARARRTPDLSKTEDTVSLGDTDNTNTEE